jgi:nucleobase:cation symporter-1, NCS1 family
MSTTADVDAGLGQTLPTLANERSWGLLDFTWAQTGLAIATWAFLFGGVTGLFVGFWDGVVAMLLGNVIGVALMLFASASMTNKWGSEHFVLQRSIYGAKGVFILIIGLLPLMQIAWLTILGIMVGRAGLQVVNADLGMTYSNDSWVVTAIALASIAVGWFVTVRGDKGVRIFNLFVAPGLILVSIFLLYALFQERTFADIASTKPSASTGSYATDFMLAVEFNIAGGLSWWQTVGNISRTGKSQRAVFWGTALGLVIAGTLAQTVGLIAALAFGNSDPTSWILPVVGPVMGGVILGFIALANITSMAGIGFAGAQSFSQHLGPRVQSLGWQGVTAAMFTLAGVLVFITSTALYDQFFLFVAWTSAIIAPAVGIAIADFHILRSAHIDVRELYNLKTSGKYRFWGGINWAAIVSLAAGFSCYLLVLNPQTLAPSSAFPLLTASLPSLVVAGLCHLVLTKLFVLPRGLGAYSD